MRVVVVCGFCFLSLLGSSCFELERGRGLAEGSIQFRVVDGAGAPVAGAVVSLDGLPLVSTSNAQGLVQVEGLLPGDEVLRVAVDDDAEDGVVTVDRAAIVTGAVKRTSFGTGLFTAPVTKLTADVLGDVVVESTGSLAGQVSGCGDLCRVVVFRELRLGQEEPRIVAGVVEGGGSVVDGSFLVAGLAAGPVKVAAFSWGRPASTAPAQQMIAASKPASFAVVDAVVVAGEAGAEVSLVLAAVAGVATNLELSGEADELERATGQAFFLVQNDDLDVDVNRVGTVVGSLFEIEPPVGVFDVAVQLDSGAGGLLRRAIAVPGVATLGPVAVGPVVGCRQVDGVNDCDGDGKNVDDDDDDDGDGQPDADEPAGCRGPGLGPDLDHDCLCEPADPFPGCASNDPIDCTVELPAVCDP